MKDEDARAWGSGIMNTARSGSLTKEGFDQEVVLGGNGDRR